MKQRKGMSENLLVVIFFLILFLVFLMENGFHLPHAIACQAPGWGTVSQFFSLCFR